MGSGASSSSQSACPRVGGGAVCQQPAKAGRAGRVAAAVPGPLRYMCLRTFCFCRRCCCCCRRCRVLRASWLLPLPQPPRPDPPLSLPASTGVPPRWQLLKSRLEAICPSGTDSLQQLWRWRMVPKEQQPFLLQVGGPGK